MLIKTTIKDLLKYLPAQIVPGIVGIISIAIVTRLFTPGEYGDYIIVISTMSMFSTVASWISLPIIRFYPMYERDDNLFEFYATLLKMSLVSILGIGLVFSSIIWLLRNIISGNMYFLMWISVPVFILTACFNILLEFLRAKRNIGSYSSFKVWRSITGIGFGIFLIVVYKFGVEGLLWGAIMSLMAALPILWKLSVGQTFSVSTKISAPMTAELAKYGLPLMTGNIAAWIVSLSDRYVLELFRGSSEVGIYSASYAVSEQSMILISSLFAATSGSIIYNLWEKEGEKKSKEFITNITRYYLLIGIPAVVGLSVLAKPLIIVLTGEEYREGYRIIPIITTGAFFLGLYQRYYPSFNIFKKTHIPMLLIFAAGLINFGLNILFVKKYGYIAAAVTTLIAYAFLLFSAALISRRYFIWPFPLRTLKNALSASIIMGLIVYMECIYMSTQIWKIIVTGTLTGLIIYVFLLFLFKEIHPEEKVLIKKYVYKFANRKAA